MAAKILVVDDEPQLQRLIKQRFRKNIKEQEYLFSFAEDGPQALAILNENTDTDIVLTDINMPKMDGLTFLTELDKYNTNLKAIMVSAYGDMKNIRTAMNRGAYDFVTKPIDFDDLEATINKALKELELLKIARETHEKLSHLQQELTVASEIQQSIVPKNFNVFPNGSKYEISAQMIPASQVGGDFYDFFMLDKERLGLVIGDVSGKGMPAALFMAISRTLLRALASKHLSPDKCLNDVNYLLSQDNPKSMFVTLFYAVIDLKTGEVAYSNGGHNSPSIITADSDLVQLNQCSGCALGVNEDFEYRSEKTTLEPGSSLVLYTDGIPEAINSRKEAFSEDRMNNIFKSAVTKSSDQFIQTIIKEVNDFTGDLSQSDDITAMVLKRNR